MVRAFLRLIHKEIAGVHQAAYVLGLFALSSQILGLIRDRMLAHEFGAGRTLDMYYAAFRIPDILFLTVASVVSVSVLIPFFIEKNEQDTDAGKQFLDSVFSFFFITVLVICGAAFLIMPTIISVVFPGFDGQQMDRVISMSRTLLLSPILLGVSNLIATITQSYQRFILHAVTPLVYNLSIIAGIAFLTPRFGIEGVVYGVLIGAFLHMMVQIPFVVRAGLFPRLHFPVDWGIVKPVVLHSAPRRVALSMNHIAILFLLSLASIMSAGSIAVFQFSFNLQSITLSLVGASYSVAAFPVLTRLYSHGDTQQFVRQVAAAGKHVIFWSLPLAVLFIVLRAQIVRTVLGTGQFDWVDTQLTAAALAIFAVSLVCQSISLLFVRAYYAAGNTKTPFLINTLSAVCIVIFGAGAWYVYHASPAFASFMVRLLRVTEIADAADVLMLPLGYTLGFMVNGALLWWSFQRDFSHSLRQLQRTLFQSVMASIFTGFVAYIGLNIFDDLFDLTTLIGVFLQGLCAGLLGTFGGIALLWIMGSQELTDVVSSFRKRLTRSHVIPPDKDTLE